MAASVRVSRRVGGQIVRYATVILGLMFCCAPLSAQQQPAVVPAPDEANWDAVTAAPAAKVSAPAVKAPAAAQQKAAKKKTLAGTTVVLPAPTAKPEGMAASETVPVVVKRGHKGDPVVVQSELPPATSSIVTGAIGTDGDAKSGAPESAPNAAAAPGDPAAATPPDAATAPAAPVPITLGVYLNDIQDIDFRTNSYLVDLYMWFRWKGKDIDPVKSVEFMNVFDPQSGQKTVLLDAPKEMPDGSLYNIVRFHGRFSKKFMLEKYPFDVQSLDFVIEDSVAPQSQQVFVADTRGVGMNPAMSLPGFKFTAPVLEVTAYTYPTDFGDLAAASAETYSRAVVSVPIKRPMFTLAIKTFGPILLIVICSTLVFFINPHFVEGRIGLAITALLTLVALQFTAGASLPDAEYFTMLDKLYMLSYGFIIASLLRVVLTSWQTVEGSLQDRTVSKRDHWWGYMLLMLYGVTAMLIASWVLSK